MAPLVSVIVPILADRDAARQLIAQIPLDLRLEIIVVEAGQEPELETLSRGRLDTTVIHARRGRAPQMNAAAEVARAQWLFFVHADSRLPSDWLDLFQALPPPTERGTKSDPGSQAANPGSRSPDPGSRIPNSEVVGGWFQFALDDPAWQARVIERAVAWRVRLFKLPYGDQGIFVRRHTFAALGGFRDIALMEDVDFVRRLLLQGPVVELPRAITTSARRWRRDGWFRRSARNITLLGLYFCGVSPKLLARWY
jgi:glycosyltransferase involved in cell wall biosynthesis